MILKKFIKNDHVCPCCNKKLTLIMISYPKISIINNEYVKPIVWVANKIKNNYKLVNNIKKNEKLLMINENDQFKLVDKKNKFIYDFYNYCFFYICDSSAVDNTSFCIDFENSCYYSSTPLMDYSFNVLNKNEENLFKIEEAFTIVEDLKEQENIYLLCVDYVTNNINFWYYSWDKNNINKPLIISKALPLTNNTIDFTLYNRKNLIEKFKKWLTLI